MQSNNYWSSTTVASNANYAWYVSMGSGNVFSSNKDFHNYVWPVRGGQ